ncbi:hypothetical protein ACQKPX_02625 [Photobacterium sp. DNB23_23_1]|uniref:DUF805 domain-containing protein n=1 Tax=Photobacterium pectinilyticum TaxID=2906793 RepID=A0ABT1N164_9GAMM|nr:hypothetical protein [Photobacterium sp. ZSDE20]MCQ1058471.1 hypothetical protein [Photobacterium sp. ZSDE20]MDD1823194.1 hypothetical protein [Photobacterium sp. ZSDE20]
MNCSKPFPGQSDQMFKDKFNKWPRIMRLLVLFSLLPPIVAFILVQNNITTYQSIHPLLVSIASLNAILLLWGLLLKVRARKYWYRNYHIGKTMLLAFVPLLACSYVVLTEPSTDKVITQSKPQIVQISVN